MCTGGADGSIRAFVAAGTDGGFGPSALAMAHSGPVKCLSSVASIGGGASPLLVASGSMDQTLLTHALVESDDDDDGVSKKGLELRPHAFYAGGHFASLSSVEMTRVGGSDGNATTMMASGDWDGGLCLWRVPDASIIGEDNEEEEEAAEGRSKKRRGAKSSSSSSSSAAASRREVEPLSTFRAHNSSVSGISFSHSSSTALLTSSWDHSVKVWDLQRLDCVLTLNGSRVVTAMGRCSNSDVVATGHPDCAVRLWDLRVSMSSKNDKGGSGGKASGTVSDNTLKPSHKAWVSAVQWSPTNPYTLVTSSHDGTVKTWDIRSSLPLHTVRAHPRGEKGLCLAYGDGCVYGGGTDCVVKRFAC
uniref:Ribosome biogenesis protein WDR12 homolog n=1 Tax=Trieres chinensis TaxID=1514140 RepID=A0A7S2EM97_TRICV